MHSMLQAMVTQHSLPDQLNVAQPKAADEKVAIVNLGHTLFSFKLLLISPEGCWDVIVLS